MRLLAVAVLSLALSFPCIAQTTLKTPPPGTLRTKTQRTRFTRDSLLFEYPILVDSSVRPMKAYECWRFTEPKEQGDYWRKCKYGAQAEEALDRGNLHTYFRGAWKNKIVSDRVGIVIMDDGTRSRPTAANIKTD